MVLIMKMKDEHYDFIKIRMHNLIRNDPGARKRYHDLDLSERLYRWDCLDGATPLDWVYDNLCPYLNDDAIDITLKQIVDCFE
jgi:hypothetical protein